MNRRFRLSRESRERMEDYAQQGGGMPQAEKQPEKARPDTEAQVSEKLLASAQAEEQAREDFTVVTRTDIGRVRASNQDVVIHAEKLCGVADGMGGHQGGEIASAFTRDSLIAQLANRAPDKGLLKQAVEAANRRLFIRAREEGPKGMGTTLSVIWVGPEEVYVAHVGDSRVYLLRDGELQQQTDDHSMVMEMVRAGVITGEQAAAHPMRNVITRAIGTESGVDVDLLTVPRQKGDVWLISTDGLHGMLSNETMKQVLTECLPDLDAAADGLLSAALEAGGHDNVSLVLLFDQAGCREEKA